MSFRDLEHRDTDRAPPPDEEPTNPHACGPIEDPEHQALLARVEESGDARWQAREDAVVKRVTRAMAASLSPILEQLRKQDAALSRVEGLLERWADNSAQTVTRVEQLGERVEHREHVCAAHHGNGASLPPGG